MKELMKGLSRLEVAEWIMTIRFYMTAARITETTCTDRDPPAGTKVIDAIQREN